MRVIFFVITMLCVGSLPAQDRPQVVLQKGHSSSLRVGGDFPEVFAVSSDERWVLTYSKADGMLVFWNRPAGKIFARYPFSEELFAARFLPGGNEVILNKSKVLDRRTGRVVRTLLPMEAPPAVHVDPTFEASRGWEYGITRAGSWLDSVLHKSLRRSEQPMHAFSADSGTLWIVEKGRFFEQAEPKIFEYDVASHSIRKVIETKGAAIRFLMRSDNWLLVRTKERVRIYDIRAGRFTHQIEGAYYEGRIRADGAYIVLPGESGYEAWALEDKARRVLQLPEVGKLYPVFRGNDSLIMLTGYGSNRKEVVVYSLSKGIEIGRYTNLNRVVETGRTERYFVVERDNRQEIISTETLLPLAFPDAPTFRKIVLSPDERHALCWEDSAGRRTLCFRSLPEGIRTPLPEGPLGPLEVRSNYGGISTSLNALFSPNGHYLALYSNNNKLVVTDLISDGWRTVSLKPTGSWHHLSFAQSGDWLLDEESSLEQYVCYSFPELKLQGAAEKELLRFVTPYGDRLVALRQGEDFEIHTVETATGAAHSLRLPADPVGLTASPDGTLLAYLRNTDGNDHDKQQVVVAEVGTGRVLDSVSISFHGSNYKGAKLAFGKQNELLYIGADRLYQYHRSERKLRSFQPQGGARYFPILENENGHYLFAYRVTEGASEGSLCMLRTDTPVVQRTYAEKVRESWLTAHSSHYNVRSYDAFEVEGAEGDSVLMTRAAEPKVVRQPQSLLSPRGATFGNKTYCTSPYEGLKVLETATGALLDSIRPHSYQGFYFTSGNRYLVRSSTDIDDVLTVFDAWKGFRKVPFVSTEGKEKTYRFFDNQHFNNFQSTALSDSAHYLFLVDTYGEGIAKVYQFPSGNLVFRHRAPYLLNKKFERSAMGGSDYKRIYDCGMTPDERKFYTNTYGTFFFVADVRSGNIRQHSYPGPGITRLAASTHGTWFAAARDWMGSARTNESLRIYVWDSLGNRRSFDIPATGEDWNRVRLNVSEEGGFLAVDLASGVWFYRLSDLSLQWHLLHPNAWYGNYYPERREVYVSENGEPAAFALPDFSRRAYPKPEGYHLGFESEFVVLYHDSIEVARALIDADGEELLWFTPSGYYALTKGGAASVGFKFKGEVYPSSVFDAVYNRPDTVFRALASYFNLPQGMLRAYSDAQRRRAVAIPAQGALDRLPELRASVLNDVTSEGRVTVKIRATSTDAPLRSLNISVNGVPFYGSRGHALTGATLDTIVTVPLLAGLNQIECSVRDDKGLTSLPATFSKIKTQPDSKPTTYFVGIGASCFQQQEYNLHYADADIRNLASLLRRKNPSVVIDTLINEAVTMAGIRRLKSRLQQTRPCDKVILFYCGHGLRDKEYYLSTYDIDFKAPAAAGLPVRELYGLLDSIPARARLLLLDACNSGQDYATDTMMRRPSLADHVTAYPGARGIRVAQDDADVADLLDEVFADLNNSTGINVIAATKGNELAYETPALSGGIFTYAVRQAIESGINGTAGEKGVRVKDLKAYVTDMVFRLSGGRQRPTSRNENPLMDWTLW